MLCKTEEVGQSADQLRFMEGALDRTEVVVGDVKEVFLIVAAQSYLKSFGCEFIQCGHTSTS